MYKPISVFIGLRYTQAKRRTQFISFVSLISLLGMILGVFALIVVMSVMNGFEAELRGRILALVPHGFLLGPDQHLQDWPEWRSRITAQEGVSGVAPLIAGNVMLSRPGMVRGARLTAVDPGLEASVSDIQSSIIAGSFNDLQTQRYGIVLGDILARNLGVSIGDQLNLVLPRVTITPLGIFPRQKNFRVVGLFSVGAQLDGDTVFINLVDGQKLFQMGTAVEGLRVELDDLFSATDTLPWLLTQMPAGSEAISWSETQGSLFKAVKMEKTMIALLLFIIVTIAAFNIISILTMMVGDKRSDIAVLRTMGASPSVILWVFVIQGTTVGLAGILVGMALGIPAAIYTAEIVGSLEQLLGGRVFDPQVYFISQIPSVFQWQDTIKVAVFGILLSVLATLYPAYRAAQVHPAEVLRYE